MIYFLKKYFGIYLLNLLLIRQFYLLLLKWQMQATFYSPISYKCTCYLYDDSKHLFVTLTIGMCSTCLIWFTAMYACMLLLHFTAFPKKIIFLEPACFLLLVLLCEILFRTSEGNWSWFLQDMATKRALIFNFNNSFCFCTYFHCNDNA